jgi:hypothetical protein
MNAIINGVVSGIGAGDSISQIEVVWKSGTETEAAAMAAGRGVTLTGDSITAFTGSGYSLSSVNLVDGQTYTPAVRVTENMAGGGTQNGGWVSGTEFVVVSTSPVIDENFESYTVGTVPTPFTYFTVHGTATVQNDPIGTNGKVFTVASNGTGYNSGTYAVTPGTYSRISVLAAMTSVDKSADIIRGYNASNTCSVLLAFGEDGHIKSHNGTTFLNLPTDTVYSANTYYLVEARNINFTTHTFDAYVDGVNKGNCAFFNSSVTNIVKLELQTPLQTSSHIATCHYAEIKLYS